MKNLIKWILLFATITVVTVWFRSDILQGLGLVRDDADRIVRAYETRSSNIMVETTAIVTLVLPDLEDQERHQMFLAKLDNGHRLLVMHNIDVAPWVPVKPGSEIRLRGEYDYTPDGGTIHWTHADPRGEREGGWIEFDNTFYR